MKSTYRTLVVNWNKNMRSNDFILPVLLTSGIFKDQRQNLRDAECGDLAADLINTNLF